MIDTGDAAWRSVVLLLEQQMAGTQAEVDRLRSEAREILWYVTEAWTLSQEEIIEQVEFHAREMLDATS